MLVLWLMAGCTSKSEEGSSTDTGTDPAETDTDATDTGATDPLGCVPDALPESWAGLTVSPLGDVDVVPGDSRDFSVLLVINGGYIQPISLCETWSVEPPTPGIAIDADGVVSVDPSVPDGTEVAAVATLPAASLGEDDDVRLSVDLTVYEPALRPWVGFWREEAQLDCETGEERAPEQAIEEIQIKASGEVLVTWTPFELYVDWRGEGAWDLEDGTVSLMPTGWNYLPPDLDGEGTFAMDGADLLLRDLWLGTPREGVAPAGCGHRLR